MFPTAQQQTAVPPEQLLHSGNATVVVERIAQIRSGFGTTAREALREACEYVNMKLVGRASAFVYEEAFGVRDRVHWYIHMRTLADYYVLMGLDARTDPDAPRASYIQDWIPPDKGGGSWERMLIQGSVRDVGLTPVSWPV